MVRREGEEGERRHGRGDAVAALLVGAATFALYLRTMLVHLGGTEDTPKFQYLGYVLGTAHNPGYPLYVLVSHLFSYLPIGTLAYRMNLLSACLGLATVLVVFYAARSLSCCRSAAAAIALSLAAGRRFWENSVIAEVYTLNGLLWAVAILKLLQWERRQRVRDLYAAFVCVALGIGNHLTILGLLPAIAIFVLAVSRRWAVIGHLLGGTAVLVLGLAQYGFIWIRTYQKATYLETRIATLSDLHAALTARQFMGRSGPSTLAELLWTLSGRAAHILHALRVELGVVGVGLAALGLFLLVRRRHSAAILLGTSPLAVLLLTVAVNDPGDAAIGGFLIPVFLTLWLSVGVALDWALSSPSGALRAWVWGVSLACLVYLPLGQLWWNYRANDYRGRTFARDYFRALFRDLPARSAVVLEAYTPGHMFTYALLSGDFPRVGPPPQLVGADVATVAQLIRGGTSVFAFPGEAAALRGYGFVFEPFELGGLTLREHLERVPAGSIVALVGNYAALPDELARTLGGRGLLSTKQAHLWATVGVKGANVGALQWASGGPLRVSVGAGHAFPGGKSRLPVGLELEVSPSAAIVRSDDAELVRADRGIGAVVLTPDGRIVDRQTFELRRGLRTALPMGHWPLVRVAALTRCVALGDNNWHEVSALGHRAGVEVRLDNYRAFESTLVLYVVSRPRVRPELWDFFAGCQGADPCPAIEAPALSWESYEPADRSQRVELEGRLAADGVKGLDVSSPGVQVARIVAAVNDQGQFVTFQLGLGVVPLQMFARARTDLQDDRRGSLCELAPGPALFSEHDERRRAIAMRGEPGVMFASGWHPAEGRGDDAFRWTAEPEAWVLLSLARTGLIRLTIEARRLEGEGRPPQWLSVEVNGWIGSPQALVPEWRSYRWNVPAAAWRQGLNELGVRVSRVEQPAVLGLSNDTRRLGVAVRRLELELAAEELPKESQAPPRQRPLR